MRRRQPAVACVGKRGPAPKAGVEFRGHAVVLRGRSPTVRLAPDAPAYVLADRRGYVSIHRWIASETEGRWLTRHEVVQVLDGNPWNWAPPNLRVVGCAAHLPHGRQLRKAARP